MGADQHIDFFVSYTQADTRWAEWVAAELEADSYAVSIQAWDVLPGANFVLEMHAAAQRAERTIVILSQNYLGATFPQPEWAAAFVRDPLGVDRRLVPVRVAMCDPPGLLSGISYIDLVGLEEAGARRRLIDGVSGRPRRSARGFPGRSVASRAGFPGAPPRVWNLAFNRNPNFTGRDDLLAELHRSLCAGEPAALVQTLAGLGGVGKTQLALEYCYRFAHEYDVVWWIRSEEATTLEADYADLAPRLGVSAPGGEPSQTAAVEACRAWFRTNDRWLLVFDNAIGAPDLTRFLPQGRGHVIITSRNPHWRSVARSLTVPVLSEGASVRFLLMRTGLTDGDAAARLAERFGHLALALEQVAAYIETHAVSLAEYLETYDNRLARLVATEGQSSAPHVQSTVATVWEISFEKVLQRSPAAADLLYLCAVLAPEEIPKEMIRRGVDGLGLAAEGDELRRLRISLTSQRLEEAVAALTQHSLIEARGDTLFIHRLVQAVTRQRMGNELRVFWEQLASKLVDRTLGDPGKVSAKQLLPQTLAAAANVGQQSLTSGLSVQYNLIGEGARIVLQIAGALVGPTVLELRPIEDRIVSVPGQEVVVDLSGLELMDSSGVGVLISLYKRVRVRNGSVTVIGARGQPLAVLRMLHLDRVLLGVAERV